MNSGDPQKLTRVSSVSGGSITAGVLGLSWSQLMFDQNGVATNLDALVISKVRQLARRTIDEGAVIGGLLLPGSISDKVTNAYRDHLFGSATLQDLPADPAPRFIINATSVQTGALWRFSRLYMADYKVGLIPNPTVEVATAVAASSAFPPVLSPLRLDLTDQQFAQTDNGPLHMPPYTTEAVFTDGGVYDNLGLETTWKRCRTVVVSDGGEAIAPESEPKVDRVRHVYRIVRRSWRGGRNANARWSRPSSEHRVNKVNGEPDVLGHSKRRHRLRLAGCHSRPPEKTILLATLPTRLQQLDDVVQERLINWDMRSATRRCASGSCRGSRHLLDSHTRRPVWGEPTLCQCERRDCHLNHNRQLLTSTARYTAEQHRQIRDP